MPKVILYTVIFASLICIVPIRGQEPSKDFTLLPAPAPLPDELKNVPVLDLSGRVPKLSKSQLRAEVQRALSSNDVASFQQMFKSSDSELRLHAAFGIRFLADHRTDAITLLQQEVNLSNGLGHSESGLGILTRNHFNVTIKDSLASLQENQRAAISGTSSAISNKERHVAGDGSEASLKISLAILGLVALLACSVIFFRKRSRR